MTTADIDLLMINIHRYAPFSSLTRGLAIQTGRIAGPSLLLRQNAA
jgi:hypothetical protein